MTIYRVEFKIAWPKGFFFKEVPANNATQAEWKVKQQFPHAIIQLTYPMPEKVA